LPHLNPVVLTGYTSKCSGPYSSNPRILPEGDFVTFDLLSQIRLSSIVCLSSVCNVGAPYTVGVEAFSNISPPLCTLFSHPLSSVENFTEIVLGAPLHRGVKRKRDSKTERFWACRRLYLINGRPYKIRLRVQLTKMPHTF